MNFTALHTKPKISVLLPVHNAELYVRKAVESVLAQTYGDFELLALDDGSTDRSLFILRDLAITDERLRIISRENRGLVPTLNELIDAARGRYLARMDADDICFPQRFERQLTFLESNPEYAAVGSSVRIIDPEGMPICDFKNKLTHEEIDAAHMSGDSRSHICHPSVMMRREAVISVGQYREEFLYVEDLDLFLRLAEKAGKLANLPQVLLAYRHHVNSICYTQTDKQDIVGRRAIQLAFARRGMAEWTDIPKTKPVVQSRADVHRKWAWWALAAGNLTSARKHAVKAWASNPFRSENLLVLACAIRGY